LRRNKTCAARLYRAQVGKVPAVAGIWRPRLRSSTDYVDPWYSYNSMTAFPNKSARLEDIALASRDRIDGIVFFANDRYGAPVPRKVIESFAERFYGGLDSLIAM
jgi:hypothetical protein